MVSVPLAGFSKVSSQNLPYHRIPELVEGLLALFILVPIMAKKAALRQAQGYGWSGSDVGRVRHILELSKVGRMGPL
jgi:hypothetical protein